MKVIDMHCDTIYEIFEAKKCGKAMSLWDCNLMVNLQKMKSGGYSTQNFALFVEPESGVSSFEKANQLLAIFKEELWKQDAKISQVTTVREILENERAGKLSAFLTIEGGEALEGSLDKLAYFYAQGVRMLTLTWNHPNEIGYPNFRGEQLWRMPDCENGLTEFGLQVVEEMEHLGMIVDVSHLSDKGFYDVLNQSKNPFVASHSNSRKVCPHVRNLTDDMIRQLAKRGGVIGLNYHSKFVAEEYNRLDEPNVNWSALDSHTEEGRRVYEKKYQQVLIQLVCHAKHIVEIGGIECLALGSDFDGIPAYVGMPKMDKMWKLTDIFQKQGFHESEIDKIFYQNVLRLYGEVLK